MEWNGIHRLRSDARAIVAEALARVDAGAAVRNALTVAGSTLRVGHLVVDTAGVRRILLAGAGKAAASMARVVEEVLGERVEPGVVVVKDGHGVEGLRTRTLEAAHPIPDERSLRGGEEMLTLLRGCGADDLVVFVLSGGASALLEALPQGVGLGELQQMTRLMLECGATIEEINTVRRALSRVKAGGLLRAAHPARVLVLVLSDIPGSPLDKIGSGPFVPGGSAQEALDVLRRRDLLGRIPTPICECLLHAGVQDGLEQARVEHVIVGDCRLLAEAALDEARRRGYHALLLTTSLAGEAREVAQVMAALAREMKESGRPVSLPACVLASGETTVTVRGQGRGGRNTEMALAFALAVQGLGSVVFASVASDGTDGPTGAAGAMVDGTTVERVASLGLDAGELLADNDSLSACEAVGDAICTGPTGTNVDDLQVLLVGHG